MLGTNNDYEPQMLMQQSSSTLTFNIPNGLTITDAPIQLFLFRDGRKLAQGVDYTVSVTTNIIFTLSVQAIDTEKFELHFFSKN